MCASRAVWGHASKFSSTCNFVLVRLSSGNLSCKWNSWIDYGYTCVFGAVKSL